MTRAWDVVASRVVLDGAPWLRVWEETVRLPSGRELKPFYRYQKPDFASVFALTPEGKVLVERRYRHGPRAVTLDLPAGYVDPGEEPLAAAKRELREETGHEAGAWTHLGTYTVDGNSGGSRCHAYLARGARRVAAPVEDDTEEMELLHLAPAEVRAALASGAFATLTPAAVAARALLEL